MCVTEVDIDLRAEMGITADEEMELFRQYILGDADMQESLSELVGALYGWRNPLEALYMFLFPEYHFADVVRVGQQ